MIHKSTHGLCHLRAQRVLYVSLLKDRAGSESKSWQGTELTKHLWGWVLYLCCDWQVWPYRAAAKPSQPKERLKQWPRLGLLFQPLIVSLPWGSGRQGGGAIPVTAAAVCPSAHPAFGQGTQAREGGADTHVKHITEEWGEKADGSLNFQSSCELVKKETHSFPLWWYIWIYFTLDRNLTFPLVITRLMMPTHSCQFGQNWGVPNCRTSLVLAENWVSIPLGQCLGDPDKVDLVRLLEEQTLHHPVPDPVLWAGHSERTSCCKHFWVSVLNSVLSGDDKHAEGKLKEPGPSRY